MRHWLCAAVLGGCGILAALLSHAAFSFVESLGALGSGYEDHAHASLPFAFCAVLLALCVAGVLYGVQIAGGGSRAHVLALARAFGHSSAVWPLLAVALVACVTLAGMERYEGDLHDAFGSLPFVGISMVAAIGATVGMAVRAFARWIADATESLIAHLCSRLARTGGRAHYRTRRIDVSSTHRLDVLRRICGNRAPPAVLA